MLANKNECNISVDSSNLSSKKKPIKSSLNVIHLWKSSSLMFFFYFISFKILNIIHYCIGVINSRTFYFFFFSIYFENSRNS